MIKENNILNDCIFLISSLNEIKDTYLYEDDNKTLVDYNHKCYQINECIEIVKIIQYKIKKLKENYKKIGTLDE